MSLPLSVFVSLSLCLCFYPSQMHSLLPLLSHVVIHISVFLKNTASCGPFKTMNCCLRSSCAFFVLLEDKFKSLNHFLLSSLSLSLSLCICLCLSVSLSLFLSHSSLCDMAILNISDCIMQYKNRSLLTALPHPIRLILPSH